VSWRYFDGVTTRRSLVVRGSPSVGFAVTICDRLLAQVYVALRQGRWFPIFGLATSRPTGVLP
jgi:hypothetical protein